MNDSMTKPFLPAPKKANMILYGIIVPVITALPLLLNNPIRYNWTGLLQMPSWRPAILMITCLDGLLCLHAIHMLQKNTVIKHERFLIILLAVLISEVRNQRFKRVVQTATYLPHFLSWVVIYGVIYAIVSESSGLINVMRRAAGQRTIPILTSTTLFTPMLFFTDVWKNAGWGAIVYLAAIAGIDPGLYEAAQIDGASRIQRIWYVTLACIRPTIVIMLILRLGSVMDAGFDQIYNLYNSQVYSVSDIIDTWVYRTGLEQLNYSTATAVGLFKSIISTALVFSVNAITRRWEESLW